jgi:hypothetical protein
VRCGHLARLRISPLLTWLVVDACRLYCVVVQVSVLSLAHAGVCLSVLQKCQILSANGDLEFPAPARGALLPLAPSARAFSRSPLRPHRLSAARHLSA